MATPPSIIDSVPDVVIATTMKFLVGEINMWVLDRDQKLRLRAVVRLSATSRRFREVLYSPNDPERIWAEFSPCLTEGMLSAHTPRPVLRQCRVLLAPQTCKTCQSLPNLMPNLTTLNIEFYSHTSTSDVQAAMRCLAALPLEILTVVDNHDKVAMAVEREVSFALPPNLRHCRFVKAMWAVRKGCVPTFANVTSMTLELGHSESVSNFATMENVRQLYLQAPWVDTIKYDDAKCLWRSFPKLETLNLSAWLFEQPQVMRALYEECHTTLTHFSANAFTKKTRIEALTPFEHLETIECFGAVKPSALPKIPRLHLFTYLSLSLRQGKPHEGLTAALDSATALRDLVLITNGDCTEQLIAVFQSKCCEHLRRLHLRCIRPAARQPTDVDPRIIEAFKARLGQHLVKFEIACDRLTETVVWPLISELLPCCHTVTDLGFDVPKIGAMLDAIYASACPLLKTVRNLDIEGDELAHVPGVWTAVRKLTLAGGLSRRPGQCMITPDHISRFPALRHLINDEVDRPAWLPSHINFN